MGTWGTTSYVAFFVPEGTRSANSAISQLRSMCGLAQQSMYVAGAIRKYFVLDNPHLGDSATKTGNGLVRHFFNRRGKCFYCFLCCEKVSYSTTPQF